MGGRYACCPRASSSRSASSRLRATSPRWPVRPSTSACARSSAVLPRRHSPQTKGPSAAPDNTSAVLLELRVENLLLLDRAELRLTPGLNVVTGETGAGKTLLAHSLDLLLGGRARSGIGRSGAGVA